MNQRESAEQRLIWGAVGLLCSLFRLNTGRAYVSGMGPAGVSKLSDNSILMKAARPIGMGFTNPRGEIVTGVSDLNGWTTIEITPEMVGQHVAVFTSIESKRTKGGRTSSDQEAWIQKVLDAGGIAFVANTGDVAVKKLSEWFRLRGAKKVDRKGASN
ncbi:hypothetical protein AH156_19830 [Salmonella enterica subsp. enterica serovar Enteritidis]|nr:hypothetical protein [Salmonella enterica subsp. enterica serovar Enteritidis]